MTLHLIKLCVGADLLDDLRQWMAARMAEAKRRGAPSRHAHVTRMTPKRADEILDGGSLYWVIKGQISARASAIVGIEPFMDADGIGRCRLWLDGAVVAVAPRPMRAFQGWRYYEAKSAPPDIDEAQPGFADDAGRAAARTRRPGPPVNLFAGRLSRRARRTMLTGSDDKRSGIGMDKDKDGALARRSGNEDIAAFVEAAKKAPAPAASGRGRLIFALDATMSRQPTWDLAQALQAKMFQAAAGLGGLDVQLVYFRGMNECRASNFVSGGQGLAELMSRIDVRGGSTQIRRVLAHARNEARRAKVGALVFIGDAMEENPDALAALAGELALLGVKAFMFQEGQDPAARRTFSEIARLTGGAYSAFDAGASARLAALLRAAAAYAAGGHAALAREASADPAARLLLSQMRKE